ncbi:MAG: isoprenylcysteine carboxyl methyltransferase family protein [Acidobacteriales bacterium]|nr:isoprenylcysteine carboxyl methyltransferase family protein [Terriglobales bacterium]
MRASNWEFSNRALFFGMVFAISFPLYAIDHENSAAVMSHFLGTRLVVNEDLIARTLFAFGAALVALAALIRTWASAFLHANVVYASEVKTAALVADGPYRRVRNPLYLANILMTLGLAPMMSRLGFVVAITAMIVFCYRLILREEDELHQTQGEGYDNFARPSPDSGRRSRRESRPPAPRRIG